MKLQDLADYYACRGLRAEIEPLAAAGDIAAQLFAAAARLETGLLVAGAFGRSRLRELIFGGTRRALLRSQGPFLFLAH